MRVATSGYRYLTAFDWWWQQCPNSGRWLVYDPTGACCASAKDWQTAARWALQRREPVCLGGRL